MLTELESKELQEAEQQAMNRIGKAEREIERNRRLLHKLSVCKEEGHICPKTSVDYYFCERCGSYIG
jgi:hypothetical protein